MSYHRTHSRLSLDDARGYLRFLRAGNVAHVRWPTLPAEVTAWLVANPIPAVPFEAES